MTGRGGSHGFALTRDGQSQARTITPAAQSAARALAFCDFMIASGQVPCVTVSSTRAGGRNDRGYSEPRRSLSQVLREHDVRALSRAPVELRKDSSSFESAVGPD